MIKRNYWIFFKSWLIHQKRSEFILPHKIRVQLSLVVATYASSHKCTKSRKMVYPKFGWSWINRSHFELSKIKIIQYECFHEPSNKIKTDLSIRQMNQWWNKWYQIMSSQTPYNLIIYNSNKFTMCCNNQVLTADQLDCSQNAAYFA